MVLVAACELIIVQLYPVKERGIAIAFTIKILQLRYFQNETDEKAFQDTLIKYLPPNRFCISALQEIGTIIKNFQNLGWYAKIHKPVTFGKPRQIWLLAIGTGTDIWGILLLFLPRSPSRFVEKCQGQLPPASLRSKRSLRGMNSFVKILWVECQRQVELAIWLRVGWQNGQRRTWVRHLSTSP